MSSHNFEIVDQEKIIDDRHLILSMFHFELYVIIYIDSRTYKIKRKFNVHWR
jgi:hypothetical protein